jgi:hypothetical protein
MATRSKNRVSQTVVRGNGNRLRTGRCSSVPSNPAHSPSELKPGNGGCDQHDALVDITRYLKVIVALAVTAEIALRRQSSEQDADIAECLRYGVVNPLSIQIRAHEPACAPLDQGGDVNITAAQLLALAAKWRARARTYMHEAHESCNVRDIHRLAGWRRRLNSPRVTYVGPLT